VDGVKLNLHGATAVRRAYNEIEKSIRKHGGARAFLGVTVQPMIATGGYELILGSSIDSQFGPVLLFGAGGIFVEIFKDRALGLPPLNRTLARRLMERTQIYNALKGFRGRGGIDLNTLEELLVRFSQLVIEQRRIKEIDINPLLVSSKQIIALDARIVLHDASVPDADLPRSTIRPYPVEYVRKRKIDNHTVTIRPIRPEDEPLMIEFHKTLSERSVQLRYFGALSLEQRTMHERLRRVCFVDYDREIALVVERKGRDGHHQLLGVGRLIKEHGTGEAEFAILVGDPWQGKGLGTELLKSLVQIGRKERVQRIVGHIASENTLMKRVSEEVGFRLRRESSDAWRAEIDLETR
jgi:acetyltransferase